MFSKLIEHAPEPGEHVIAVFHDGRREVLRFSLLPARFEWAEITQVEDLPVRVFEARFELLEADLCDRHDLGREWAPCSCGELEQ